MRGMAGVAAFVAVADTQSFREAGARLNKTPSGVSKAVGRLEQELGVRLLARTTRSVALTPEGQRFLVHAREALRELRAGRDAVQQIRGAVRGTIAVSIPPALGPRVANALPTLLQDYPDLNLVIQASDRKALFVKEGVDIAVRIGELVDSSLIARRLGTAHWRMVASPPYLAAAGEPKTAADLATHTALLYRRANGGVLPLLTVEREEVTPANAARTVLVNEGNFLLHLSRVGGGIAQVFDFMLRDELETGALVSLLEGCGPPPLPVHALCTAGQQHTPRIRVVLDWLAEHLLPSTPEVQHHVVG